MNTISGESLYIWQKKLFIYIKKKKKKSDYFQSYNLFQDMIAMWSTGPLMEKDQINDKFENEHTVFA